ncbi:glycosyltransferase [Antrihabitans sp. YC2-6]|uniref:glycosyltransferase n=1 Tax=Antrihabitans sp. YC2-6 TaxID=2799498 RepID=UPI0018F5C453|nr:glycosyltransferase [Antrihabitans sp. YC2-6]MBJ8348702.1 glycosyltransferase [Antrihabitans sp. YC2-6]
MVKRLNIGMTRLRELLRKVIAVYRTAGAKAVLVKVWSRILWTIETRFGSDTPRTRSAGSLPEWLTTVSEPVRRSSAAVDADHISVVIPSYNHSAFIRQAILSVAHQTYPNVQLVIIDDGSTDDSVDVITQTLADVEFTDVVFEQQANQGAHAAINNGIKRCSGTYISILNSDDVFHPERLARLHSFTVEGGFDFAFTEVTFSPMRMKQSDVLVREYDEWLDGIDEYPTIGFSLIRQNGIRSSSNFFFAARLLDKIGLFREFVLVNDWDFALRALRESEPGFLREPLLWYRRHENSTLQNESTVQRSVREYKTVLTDYFKAVRRARVPNTLAPSPRNWPGFFETFATQDRYLTRYTDVLPTVKEVWEASELDPDEREELLTPPQPLMEFVGSLDADHFHWVGDEFFQYFLEYGHLQPDHRVLDIGCGSGRMAIPLATYLSESGSYRGFDIAPEPIAWCSATITPQFPNFEFARSDVRNSFYNPDGPVPAAEYRFPYADSSFDFAFLTSVFTHLLPGDLDRYISEIARVLAPGGRCLATFFLENEESRSLLNAGKSSLAFQIVAENYRTISKDKPEHAVCYDEQYARSLFAAHGLAVADPVRYGNWCGRKQFTSYQDIVIVEKPQV